MTVSRGQWDALIESAYKRGWVLLEMDENEKAVRAYQKQNIHENN